MAFVSGVFLALADPAYAGDPTSEETSSAPQLAQPAELRYPPEATGTGAHGDVRLRVEVDESGVVTSVIWIDGLDVFRAEAERAAATLRFSPASRDGVAVRSSTVVSFHFAPPTQDLEPVDDEIVVTGSRAHALETRATATLSEAVIERNAGQDLAETVAETPGVTLGRGSADVAKPIVRGQVERRLLLLVDGIRHESQKWGADHAPEIDPFAAGEIQVVKGAAGVRYGPDAIGGVILVKPPPLREEPGVSGKALLVGALNGRRGMAALRLDVVPKRWPDLAWRVEGNVARGAAQSAPDYVLGNTASQTWNAGTTLRFRRGDSDFRLDVHHYDFAGGVFYGIVNATPAEFESQLVANRPLNADLWETTYAIDRPRQTVAHDLAALHVDSVVGMWSINGVYSFQMNRRREFEQARQSVTGPQYDFLLRTHAVDGSATHDPIALGSGALQGGFGLQGSFQENVYSGLPLIPNFRAFHGGVSARERWTATRSAVELGVRYDHLNRTGFLGESDYRRHERRGTLDEASCAVDADSGVARCPAQYDTASVSLGGIWRSADEALELKFDLSSASRFPQADELYLMGSAPSYPVFAYGAPNLATETTWGASPTVAVHLPWLDGEISPFANYVQRYIQFAPERGADGSPAVEVTIRGAFPAYGFHAIDAYFAGLDGGISLFPQALVGIDVQGAIVRARSVETGAFLIGIPADNARASLVARREALGAWRSAAAKVSVDAVARQSRVDPALDFAAPPPGYVLVGLSASAERPFGARTLSLGVEASNVLNQAYREYTSLLRYYADQPGCDVRVRVGLHF